jgi:hypothetical protein
MLYMYQYLSRGLFLQTSSQLSERSSISPEGISGFVALNILVGGEIVQLVLLSLPHIPRIDVLDAISKNVKLLRALIW